MFSTDTTETSTNARTSAPSIYDYLDFRAYLSEAYAYRKSVNPRFSENAFALAAGFGKNSRGYLGLVVKGKRNLTAKSIIGFAKALNLSAQEALFFENMVHFCQAESEKERIYFFERIKVAAQGESSAPVDLLERHLRFLSEWHLVVLREMITLADFREEHTWVHQRLNGQISLEKISQGFEDLQVLGLISRNVEGKLVQTENVMIFKDTKTNFKNTAKLHSDFATRMSQAMVDAPYEKRAAQLITLSVPNERFEELRKEMQEITQLLLKKYAHDGDGKQVVQMGIQLLQVTI
jgi:uncharacterized protein (TIGR02147 family)